MAENNSNGMDTKTASWFSYVLAILSAIIVLVLVKDDKTARGHAWQSLVMGVIFIIGYIILAIIVAIVVAAGGWRILWLFSLLYAIWGIGWLALSIICIWQVLQDKFFKVPVVYSISEKFNK